MTKQLMLLHLFLEYKNWEEVRDSMIHVTQYDSWYPFWEGEEVEDFGFCGKDPRGDDCGEFITKYTFEQYQKLPKYFTITCSGCDKDGNTERFWNT